MKPYQLHPAQILRHNALYLAIISALYPSFSAANPSGAQVISGQVSIDQSVSGVTTIKNSPNAIINWQNFNIAKNEITQFIQQNGQSAVLNRIVGGNPSEILGSLYSNGKVFLINPNGIVFGAGSQIDTQGLLASSLNLSDNDFQKGNFHFIAGSKAGDIANEGIIHAGKDGNIVLVAPNIQNNGIIKSEGGKIVLAAGQELILTSMDDPEIRFQVQAPKNHVLNVGQLLTEGGSINVFAGSIKHSGDISADSVEIDKQGNIRLVAKADVTLEKDSTISANNEKGVAGKIEVTGENVALLDNSKLEAIGEKGGGEILVGGDYQGKNAAVQNAQNTVVAEKVEIKADAKNEGNGGKVIVWSDNETKVAATFSAKGGKKSGDGGLVETSGKKLNIEPTIKVDTTAPKGKTGKWLLDPVDVDVDATLATTLSSTLSSTNAQVDATNNITVSSPVSWSANLLTLNAGNNLTINATIDAGAAGQLAMNYTGTYSVNAPVNLPAGNNLTINSTPYTVITNLGVAGDATSTTLQGMKNALSGNFALGGNIDATATSGWNTGAGFEPVGNSTTAFLGKFDGLNHTISNLTINRSATDFVGLFGKSSGTIQNVGIANANITGNNKVGSLIGGNLGSVRNSYSAGAMTGLDDVGGLIGWNGNTGTASTNYNMGVVTGSGNNVGGLIGGNLGDVSTSYNTGAVSGTSSTGSYVGGLIGWNNGIVSNSYSTGTVIGLFNSVGGLLGQNEGSVNTSYSTGTVSGYAFVGGLLGYNYNGNVNNSYSTGAVSANNNFGALVGWSNGSVSGNPLNTSQMMTQSNLTGFDFTNTWWMSDTNTRPFLRSEWSSTITNAHQLQLMSMNLSANYTLAKNLDLSSELSSVSGMWDTTKGFVPVGDLTNNFTGSFDGQNHTISNLTINRPTTDYVGLFGSTSSGNLINNVGLVNISITGRNEVGSLVGSNGSAVNNSYSTGTISGIYQVGGLTGQNLHTINNSYSNAAVNGTNRVGGLTGYSNWEINNSYSTGNISGSDIVGGLVGDNARDIDNSYSTGNVSGTTNVGGLVGLAETVGVANNSFWNINTSGQSNSAGGTGLNTAQMQDRTNFTSWDFANTWTNGGLNGATPSSPHLLWQGVDLQTISGQAATLANKTFSYSVDGVLRGSVTAVGSVFSVNTWVGTGNLLVWLSGQTEKAAVLTNSDALTDLKLELDTIYGTKNLDTATLETAKGSLSDAAIPFDFDGLTLKPSDGATSLALKANNNVIINNAISSNGANVSIKAGKSIVLAADKMIDSNGTSTSGSIEIVANADTATDGINNAHRDAGQAIIEMQTGANLDAGLGLGMIAIMMRRQDQDVGDITLANNLITDTGDVKINTNNAVTLNGTNINTNGGNIAIGSGTYAAGSYSNYAGNVFVSGNASLTAGTGNINIKGNSTSSEEQALLSGIDIQNATLQAENISLDGKSQTNVLTSSNTGVYIENATLTATNALSITGDGRNSLAWNHGIEVKNSNLSTTSGNVSITGTAAGDDVSALNMGVAYTENSTLSGGNAIDIIGSASGNNSINQDIEVNANISNLDAFTFTGNVINNGTLNIGGTGAIGTLNVNGDFTQSSTGVLNFEIGGASSSDALMVSETATLAGTVNISAFNGYDGTNLTSRSLLSAQTLSGTLTQGTNAFSGFELSYSGNAMNFAAISAGLSAFFDNSHGDFKWSEPTNWSIDILPTNMYMYDLTISNYAVVLDVEAFAKSLTISGTGSLSGSNRLTVVNNVTYNASGSVTLPAITANSLTINYGQNAEASNNPATYTTTAPITLPAGRNFTTKLGSDGTPDNYTVINSANALNELQAIGSDLTDNYALGANIDATATSTWNETTAGSGVFQGFTPIGTQATAFTGKFDGLGHIVSNLAISRAGTDGVGLFGYTYSSEIKNVGLVAGTVLGGNYVGGLVGYSNGTVSNSYNTSAVSGTDYVGGLLGIIDFGTVSNSYSTGTVSGTGRVGGLLGYNYNSGSVNNSYSTGAVSGSYDVGGLLGINIGGTVSNSYSTGTVTGTGTGDVGGLLGYNSGTVSNSFWDKTVNSNASLDNGYGTGLTTAQMTHATNFTGFNFSGTWSIQEGSSYPYLTSIPLINRPSLLSWGGSNCVTGVCFYPTDTNNLYDWNTALNWNTNTIPDANSSVYLSGFTGTVYYTDLTSSIAALTIGAGVGLDLSSTGTATALNISGTSLINGSLNVNNSTFAPASGITGSGSINYDVTGDLALPLITAHSVSVSASGNVTQTAPITATNLSLLGSGNYTLTNNNVIGTLAAGTSSTPISSLDFGNSGDLTIGSIYLGDSEFAHGVTTTGEVSIATHNTGSNLTVNKPVSTTSTSSSAIKLNAGSIETTTTTGNIIFGANGGVSVGVGGRAELYSGSISGTTLPSGLIPAGNFRYNSDESIAHYTAPITAAGNYAIYREQPTLTVTPSVSSMTYGDVSPTLTPSSYSGMKNGDTDAQIFVTTPILTIGGVTSTSGNYAAGNHPISSNAVEQLGYLVNYGSFTVNPQNLAITAIGNNKTYDSTTSATVNLADNRIPGDVFTTSYGSASFSDPNVGTAKPITVSGIGISGTDANNYTFNTTTTTSADITAALLHAISLSGTRVYDGTTTVNAGIFTLSGLKGSDDLTLSGAGTIADKNVGTNKSVSLGTLALGNGSIGLASNYTFAGGTYTVNITPAPLSITATPVIKVYGNVDPQLTYTASGLIGSDSLAGTLTRTAGENIGQYPITIGSLNNPNYTISYTPADFTITAAALALAITADNQTRLYGAVNPTFTGKITNGQLKNGDTLESLGLSFSTTATPTSGVGNYPITPAITNTNYVFTGNNGTLAITPASLSVTANAVSKKFGEVDPNLTFTSNGLIGNDALVGNLSRDSGENVGNYAIIQGSLANPNYNISYTGANFTINPVALNLAIQADSKTRLYGASNPIFTGTIASGSLQNGDTLDSIGLTFSTDATSTSNVGNYQIIPALTNQNYIFTGTNGILSVTPASLTVTANALSKNYGETDPALTYSVSGLIGNDALVGNLSRASGENVGNYAIIQGSLANPNYNISYTGANFTINPAILNLAIQADSKTRLYGASNPIFTGTIAAGSLQNGDTLDSIGLTFSTDATSTSNVGNYQIIPALSNQNYIFTGTNGVLSVTPASLTVTANTLSKIYGETDPALTYSVSGLIGNDALAGNLSRASGENAGNYAITQGSLANPNYTLNYVGAELGVSPANLTITANPQSKTFGEADPTLTFSIQGLIGEDKLTGELSRIEGETVKTYEITSNVSAGDNYKLSYIPNFLTIDRAPKITWISQTDNQWQNAANWNQGVLPDSTQDVSIPNTSFNIDMAGTINVNSLFSLASLHLVDGASVNVTNPFTLQIGTVLSGNGSFITPQFINNGTFSPGNSPGAIGIAGDFVQTESGLLKMEIQDETPSGYDQLNISGDATLNGTIKLISLNGYKPSPNFQPKFLSASGGFSGLFNRIDNSESPALNYKFNFVDGQLITALLPDSFEYESIIRNLADDANQAEFIISEVEKGTDSQMNTVITMSPQQTTFVTEEELKKNNNLVSVVEKGSTTFANKSTKTLGVCQ